MDTQLSIVFWLSPDDPYRTAPVRKLSLAELGMNLIDSRAGTIRTVQWPEISYVETEGRGGAYVSGHVALRLHYSSGQSEFWIPVDPFLPEQHVVNALEAQALFDVINTRLTTGQFPEMEPNPYLRSLRRPKHDSGEWDRNKSPHDYEKEGRLPSRWRRAVPILVMVVTCVAIITLAMALSPGK